jgi:hypothetical protein
MEVIVSVEDDPKYKEWTRRLDLLKEANDRFRDALDRRSSDIEAKRRDLHEAQKLFNQVSDEIE